MKNIFKGFILLLTLACFSCQDEADINGTSEKTAIADGDLAIIKSLGFDETSVIDRGDYYSVEGDIMILKENMDGYKKLFSQSDTLELRQAYANNKVAIAKAMNITVGFIPLSQRQERAFRRALEIYNKTETIITMSESLSNSGFTTGHIKIIAGGPEDSYAQSAFPSADGSVGATIKLNLTACNTLSEDQLVFLLVHELGHCLGFRHTNWQQDNELVDSPIVNGANHVPGTPTGTKSDKDNTSVFNSGNFYGTPPAWNGFSNYDIMALKYLFAPNMGASVLFVGVGETVAFSISAALPPVTWEAVSNAVLVDGQGTRTATFKATGNGYMKVKATKSLGNGRYYVVENSQPWAGKPAAPKITPIASTFYANCTYEVNASNIQNGTTLKWSVIGGTILYQGNQSMSLKVYDFGYDGTVTIKVDATNAYGTTSSSISVKAIGAGDPGGPVGPEI